MLPRASLGYLRWAGTGFSRRAKDLAAYGSRRMWPLLDRKDLAIPSNKASLRPSAGARAGWGLEKPLPALVADMAEGGRAPSHELRGSWASAQGGRPGDPGHKFPRYRQSDVAPPVPCRQICCRVSSEGELCSPSTCRSIRQSDLGGLSSTSLGWVGNDCGRLAGRCVSRSRYPPTRETRAGCSESPRPSCVTATPPPTPCRTPSSAPPPSTRHAAHRP